MKSRRLAVFLSAALLSGGPAFAQLRPQVVQPQASQPTPQYSLEDSLSSRYADGIVAIAEDKVITVEDVRNEIQNDIPEIERESHNDEEFQRRIAADEDAKIQDLIDRVLIVKDFHKDDKKHIPQSFIDNAVNDFITEEFNGDQSKFLAYLRARGETKKDFDKEQEEKIIYDYEIHQQRRASDTISPVRIEEYYKENKDQFYQDDRVHMRVIQLLHDPGVSDDQLKAKAETIIGRFKAGEKFGDLAKEYSEDTTSRSKGGDYDWLTKTNILPEFSGPVFALKKGDVTDPIMTPKGCFILYVEDRKYAGIQPLDAVRDDIERILAQNLSNADLEKWKERLRRSGYVKHF